MAAAAAVASRLAGGKAAQTMQGALAQLVSQGIPAEDAVKYLKSLPGAKREVLQQFLTGGTLLGGNALLDFILSRPTPPSEASPSTGKYFPDPASDLALEQDYRREMFNRAVAGIFGYKPEYTMRTPAEARAENEARALRMAEDLTRREIEKLQANRAFDVEIEQIARDALVRQAELEALGGVQKQRLESSYGLAQGVLENAIENVLKSGTITDRSTETALAAIQ